MQVNKTMDDTFSSALFSLQQHNQQPTNNGHRRGGIQNAPESTLPHRASQPSTRQVNLTGFLCEPGHPDYAEAAKATGTKGNVPVYWFKLRHYDNGFYDEINSVHEIDTISQAERDAILYPHTVKKSDAPSIKTKPRRELLTAGIRDLMSKGKKKKVQFMEKAVADDNDQSLNKPAEDEEDGRDNSDVEMVEEHEQT